MSLDVWLVATTTTGETQPAIYIRDNGGVREISREEWARRFPDREPVMVMVPDITTHTVFDDNITHNLGRMAQEAGCYPVVWRPDENGVVKAEQLIAPLATALETLRADPERFRAFDASNGWGRYDDLVDFLTEYHAACVAHPTADVHVSR